MYQTIIDSVIRGIIAFFLLVVVLRLMGRKAVSHMTFSDFGVAITLGSLAANLILNTNNNAVTSATGIVTLGSLALIVGYMNLKSFRFRKLVNSEPVTLIENGRVVKDNLRKTRITLDTLNTLLREKNVFNIADVEFAIFETTGKLSVLPISQKQPLTPSDLNIPTTYKGLTKDVIIDGNVLYENLKGANLDEQWLMNQLKVKGIESVKAVFFAALDTSGSLYVSKGLEGKEKPGQYGIE